MKKILGFVASLAVATALFADAGEHIRKAPPLTFNLPDKGAQTLEQYKGKVVALEFIFTTCPHCQAASHYMTELQNQYGSRGLQVIDVAVNPNADLLVDNFAKEFQTSFPVGWTASDNMVSFMNFGSARYVVPQLVLLDRNGNIHWQTPPTTDDGNWEKLMDKDAIRQHIEQLLSAPSTANVRHTAHSTKKTS